MRRKEPTEQPQEVVEVASEVDAVDELDLILDDELEGELGPTIEVHTAQGDELVLRDAFRSLAPLPDISAQADPLTVYLARLRNLPILSADEQQNLATRYKEAGDIEAARVLILTNLRLVVKIAREYRRRWTNLLELIQEGNVGLSEAIRRYDPYRQVKFTSYAQYWIRAMILNYLMNHFQPVRIGSTRAGRKLFYNLKKARAQLVRDGYLNPTPALIAEKLGVPEKDVIEVSQHLDVPPLSLEQKAPGYEDTTVGDLLADRGGVSPEEVFAKAEFEEKIREAMDEFSETIKDERERALWDERLVALEAITLSELGERFNVSKERIRQLEARLKDRFKTFLVQRLGSALDIDTSPES
ncbi:MAG: sigma-70 family RNA polymerase sigma factor [Myxococcota bacterium]|nr:sigma-70 family RNA polymerase sigma factor [Myxococcota bacterium]